MLRLRRRSIALLAIGALAVLATGVSACLFQPEEATVKPGAKLSELRVGTTLFGSQFDAQAQRGKIVVVTIGGG